MEDRSQSVIRNLSDRLKNLSISDVANLNFLLDEISSINYKTVDFSSEEAENLLKSIVVLIPGNNDHILSKFCSVLQFFCLRHKATALSDHDTEFFTDFLIKAAEKCGSWVQSDVLFALSSVLYRSSRINEKVLCSLLKSGSFLLRAFENSDISMQYSALKCLQILTLRSHSILFGDTSILQDVLNICISCLQCHISSADCASNCKVLLFSLRCLENIFCLKVVPLENLGSLLGLLKAMLYCGLPGHRMVSSGHLYPTLMSISDDVTVHGESSKMKRKTHRIRPRKKSSVKKHGCENSKPHESESDDGNSLGEDAVCLLSLAKQSETCDRTEIGFTSSSESDFSDADETLKVKALHTSIRQHAYSTLQALVKATDRKVMFGYWSSFLPHCTYLESGTNCLNIFTTILKDPAQKVRLCAIGLLTEMLRGSRPYLSLVDDRNMKTKSFISASSVLTSMINELHRCLLLALVSETSHGLLTQILKCYAILVENVPYKRLSHDLLLKLIKHLKHLMYHKDVQVQVASLTVFGSILNSEQVPAEVTQLLLASSKSNGPTGGCEQVALTEDLDVAGHNSYTLAVSDMPWIMSVCRDNIMNKCHSQPPLPVIVESLQLLAVISGKYFDVVRPLLPVMEEIISLCFKDSHSFLQLHGTKLLEVIGRGLLFDVNNKEQGTGDTSASDKVFAFWSSILNGSFPSYLMNTEQPTSRAVCCDCLSTIPGSVFTRLPEKVRIFCVTFLFGLSSDSDQNVRGAAVRCLGVYALFPPLREDMCFLDDSARVLVHAAKDDSVVVRVKACWALGNLTDALLSSRNEYPDFLAQVTVSFIYSLGMASVKAAEGCDRMRANAVRALGNLLYFLPRDFLEFHEVKEFVKGAHPALISALSARVMKVCWNACYAFKNALQNRHLVSSGLFDVGETIRNLMATLKCQNFKVKINGAAALSSLPSRELYGDLFPVVFANLAETIASAQVDVDYKEVKHFQTLHDAVCFSLCQLLCLADISDLHSLQECSLSAVETLLTSMWKFGQSADLEKISVVCNALNRMDILHSSDPQIVELWRDILSQARVAFYQEQK